MPLPDAQPHLDAFVKVYDDKIFDLTKAAIDISQAWTEDRKILLARIAELEANMPTTLRGYVGACPQKSPNTYQSVVDRFGPGVAIRGFRTLLSGVSPRPAGAGHMHISWDHGDSYSSRGTVGDYKAAAANLLPGDAWERQHESDAKLRANKATFAMIESALTDFAAKAEEARPDLITVLTLTGWLFSNNATAPGKAERDKWGPLVKRFGRLGVDLDGVHGWPYPDYTTGHLDNILRFMDQFGIERFAVPELGTSRNATRDPNGAVRIEWFADHHAALQATGRCDWTDAYVYESTAGNDFNPVEAAAWSQYV